MLVLQSAEVAQLSMFLNLVHLGEKGSMRVDNYSCDELFVTIQ